MRGKMGTAEEKSEFIQAEFGLSTLKITPEFAFLSPEAFYFHRNPVNGHTPARDHTPRHTEAKRHRGTGSHIRAPDLERETLRDTHRSPHT